MHTFGQLNIQAYQPPHLHGPHVARLFEYEEVSAVLLVLPPGGVVDTHHDENAHEVFDVIDGVGRFLIDSRPVSGEPGKCVFVPAGTERSLHNNGDKPWTLRVTSHQQVYPRHLGKLLGRAIRKRLGVYHGL